MVTNRAGMKGATADIGNKTVRQLVERGASVLVHGRTAEEAQADHDAAVADQSSSGRRCARRQSPCRARISSGPGIG
ncbi:hypothetical protein [Streptomyces sp. NPDC048196]|uniref:hypothetical protein n=1 Tax=Streptomyces sp. NPDC048196 TaxID=3154712 RepID=UPI003404B5C2